MTTNHQRPEAIARGARMLRTALGPAIARLLEDPAVVEVMLNPDGRLWIDRLSEGLSDTGERLSAADGERIVRLVAHHVGAEVHARSPRVSAELPESGERFEGLLPPVVAAPTFAIRKPAVAVFTLDDYVAAGIMSINRHHGGAIEDCARYLARLLADAKAQRATLDTVATGEVTRIKSSGDRISGFGHRIHTKDPRTVRLFELAREAGLKDDGATHMGAARAVERAFAAIGKPLPINVDGAIGAILADLGLDPAVFNGIFMIARTPGLVAHVVEEQTREKPMRRIDPVNHAYDGPTP